MALLQDADDLLFAETAFPHRLSARLENRLTSNCGLFRVAVTRVDLQGALIDILELSVVDERDLRKQKASCERRLINL
ncbi:hypothetical protein PVT71_17055 [Salipiger sp. H15]|uniref:Uncharacterized protein n=1 Tax=Alloyangia sp. H15 TaxID=3029062 RepID=A0AAU8AP87_9RHOB